MIILKKWFQFLRLANILIMVMTFYLIRMLVLVPYAEHSGIELTFSDFHFTILIIVTALTASAGNIINDIYDIKIDEINKLLKTLLENKTDKEKEEARLDIALAITIETNDWDYMDKGNYLGRPALKYIATQNYTHPTRPYNGGTFYKLVNGDHFFVANYNTENYYDTGTFYYYQFNGIYEQILNLGVSNSEIQNILTSGQYNSQIITLSSEVMSKFYSLYHTPAVGASGAVYGVLVAFGMYFKDAKLALIFFPIPIAAKYFIPVLIAFDLFFGMTKYSVGNIAHFAHIGGAFIGFIIAWYWKKNQFKTH